MIILKCLFSDQNDRPLFGAFYIIKINVFVLTLALNIHFTGLGNKTIT